MSDPDRFWQPWVGHYFPGLTPSRMSEITLDVYVDMHRFAEGA